VLTWVSAEMAHSLQSKEIPKYIQSVPGGKVNILGRHSIGHSKQKIVYVHVLFHCIVPQLFDKKEIFYTVSDTGIYCSSDKVGRVYPV
jgi:hypothetical protein